MKQKNYEAMIRARVEPGLVADMEQACETHGISMSELIRTALREKVNANATVAV